MRKISAPALLLTLFTILAGLTFPLETSYASDKHVLLQSTFTKEGLNETFYNLYWLSLTSILALPIALRLFRTKKDDDIDEVIDYPKPSNTGIKGGISKTELDTEEDL
jgi:hypothetical protein